ncbi:MAG: hypothetical protein ACREV7_18070 [Steroidobacteraceae bacterium]
MLQEQGLGDDGANTAGTHELRKSDDELNREEDQVTHRQGRLPWPPFRTRLLRYGTSRHNFGIRTPQVEFLVEVTSS